MKQRPQTIQVFLPSGDPQGVRVAEVTTRTVRVFDVPRKLIGEFLAMPEAEQVGVYILLGEDDPSGGLTPCYIGQSGKVGKRITEHDSKDFWTRALIAVSLTNNLTDTHSRYLEWASIQLAVESGRADLDNGNGGTKPHTPAPLLADCEEFLETIRILAATLGAKVLEPLPKGNGQNKNDEFTCSRRGATARAIYTQEGMLVLSGSVCATEDCPVATTEGMKKQRKALKRSGVIAMEGGALVFKKDHLFGSPSGAASFVLYRSSNGWVEWKRKDGKTLNEVQGRKA